MWHPAGIFESLRNLVVTDNQLTVTTSDYTYRALVCKEKVNLRLHSAFLIKNAVFFYCLFFEFSDYVLLYVHS